MPDVLSFGRLETASPPQRPAPKPETPFRIAILGDFRGRREAAPELSARKPIAVTRDTLDDALAKLASLHLDLPSLAEPASLSLAALDHFHPDEIHDRLAAFQDLEAHDKAALMAAVLHHPEFQALEAAWRGVDWLLRRVGRKDGGVEVVLYDLALAELRADLSAAEDLTRTGLHRLLIDLAMDGPRGQPWGLLVGLYSFDTTAADAALLGRLGKIAARASASFLAAGPARALGRDFEPTAEGAAAWSALRELPEACRLGLAVPRFLLRLPYGENTRSIDRFRFEEFTGTKSRDRYLWANPALAGAALLGAAFLRQGWGLKPGTVLDLEGMPMHAWRHDGEEEVTLTEAWLTRPDVERLVQHGFMPLLCVKGKDAVQLFRFCSLARPPKGQQASDLAGCWSPAGVGMGSSAPPPAGAKPTAPPPAAAAVSPARGAHPKPAGPIPPPAPAAPAEDDLDPELAALMRQLESGLEAAPAKPQAAPPAAPTPPPAEEELDPELAALMKQLEAGSDESAEPAATAPPAPEPAAGEPRPPDEEALDPELAALMKQLEAGSADAPPPAPSEADEEIDAELAALMKQLETGGAAPPPPPQAVTGGQVDDELAALMKQLEGEDSPAVPAPEPEPQGDLRPHIEALGGLAALEELGWPTFACSFREDLRRQWRILKDRRANPAVAAEVQRRVAQCGGYEMLGEQGIRPDLGPGAQLARLREVCQARERAAVLTDANLLRLATGYGARLKGQKTDDARIDLLLRVREHERWAADPRNASTAAALEGTTFEERWQVQLQQQLDALGGEPAYFGILAAYPHEGKEDAPLRTKLAVLSAARELEELGGDRAYEDLVGYSGREPVAVRLDKLKATLAARD